MPHQRPLARFGSVRCALTAAIAAACTCTGAAHAQQSNPMFVSNNNQGEMVLSAALSDNDQLIFRAAGPGGTGMFGLQPSSPPTAGGVIITIRGTDLASPAMSAPSTNSSGDFAFSDFDGGASALFVRRGGGNVITINGSNFRSSSMGHDGTVFANVVDASGGRELLAYPPGGDHLTIVGSSLGLVPSGRAAQTTDGTVVSRVTGAAGEGYFAAAPGGWSGTIPFLESYSGLSEPAASGGSVIVYTGLEFTSNVRGVFAVPVMGGDIITIRGENFFGPGLDFSEPAANDAGAVVFARLGLANGGIERIEYGDLFGSEVRTLVSLGDALLDSTIVGLSFNPDGLNEAGDFAYGVQLADGRSAIMLASNIPAPGSLVLIVIGSAACLRRKRAAA